MSKKGRWASTDQTQQRILDAAVEVFSELGYDSAKMADVVERSGTSIGSIYHHFGGKPELFQAIWDRVMEQLSERIDEDDWM